MNVILIRHGLPKRVENTEGQADPELDEVGREQARRMADWLKGEHLEHILVSPMTRALNTAQPLCEQLGLEPEIVPEFSEISRYSRDYIPIEQLKREKHPIWEQMLNRDWDALGFMDPQEFMKNVVIAFRGAVQKYSGGNMAIVAHGGTINAIVSSVLEMEQMFFCEVGYTSISRLRSAEHFSDDPGGAKEQRFTLVSLNEMAHLHAARDSLEKLPEP